MNLADLDPETLRAIAEELTERIERCIESREGCFKYADNGALPELTRASWRRSGWRVDGALQNLTHFRQYLRAKATRIETKRRKVAA